MKKINAILCICLVLALCVLLGGCSQGQGALSLVTSYEISPSGQLVYRIGVDPEAAKALKKEYLKQLGVDYGLNDAALNADFTLTFGDYKTALYKQEDYTKLSETHKDLQLTEANGSAIKFGTLKDASQYETFLIAADPASQTWLKGSIPASFEQAAVTNKTMVIIPGTVYYHTPNVEIAGYDFIMGQTLAALKPETADTCILFKYDIPLGWKIGILAAGIVILAAVIILIVTLARRKQGVAGSRGSSGVVKGISGMYKDQEIDIRNGEPVFFGRDPVINNIVFDDRNEKVSRKHCSIRYDKSSGSYYVADFSRNGTFMDNNMRLEPERETSLPGGSVVYLGSRENAFRLG